MNILKRSKKYGMLLLSAITMISLTGIPHQSTRAASQINGPKDAQEVQSFVDSYFSRPEVKSKLAGAAVVIVKDDKVLLNKGYGYSDIQSKKQVDPDQTYFRMASISKLFTATGVMQLAEEGKVDLDKSVEAYLGDIKIPNQTGSPLTLKHLMTHTSGFDYTDGVSGAAAFGLEKKYPLEQYVKDYLPTIVRKPGTAYRYDNYAYTLQGYIIQKVTNKPFEAVMKERILNPLGMKHSDFQMTSEVLSGLATSYDANNKPRQAYPNIPTIAPDGGLFSTSTDFSKYMLAMLNGGKLGETAILKPSSVAEMQKPHVALNSKLPNAAYGFEMFHHESFNGQQVVGKGGDLEGYHSWMWLLPEQKVGGFIVINNDNSGIRNDFFQAFMDHYYPKQSGKPIVPLQPTQAELSQFEGAYRYLRIPLLHFDVTAKAGYLEISGPSGTHKLEQLEPLLFQDEEGRLAAFRQESDGSISYLSYDLPDAWSEKLPSYKDYQDVPKDSPYAAYINNLRKLGGVLEADAASFNPEKPLTRGEFAAMITRLAGVKRSNKPSIFADVRGHQYEADIQTMTELGAIRGTAKQVFLPDQIIKREEVAAFIYHLSKSLGFPTVTAKLHGEVPEWAREAVQFVVGSSLIGPDVRAGEAGSVDYRAADPLLRQEAAVILTKFAKLIGSE
ncbi:hypothetical protein DCC85_10080 [Paenibacillus sp. CAA11]|nr:hypothetical protein DCC85_10080 [Paenibacillus sp. CAA11]